MSLASTRPGRKDEEELERVVHEVRLALSQIRYGSVEIVVQDSRVVQIERREKVRFEPARVPGERGTERR